MEALNLVAWDLDLVLWQSLNRNPLTPCALVFSLSINEVIILGDHESGMWYYGKAVK